MAKKITKLPADIEAKLSTIRDEWLAYGLSCQPADRLMAEKSVALAYQAAGLPSPKIIVWLRSPMEGAFGAAILSGGEGIGNQVRDQVVNQVGNQVRDQVWGQVGDQVRDQVGNQVGDQVWNQVWNQVRDQVGNQVRDQVGNQVWNQVWNQVRDQVGNQVRDQVGNQVRDQVWNQVWNQVRDQVGNQVRDQVWNQVGDQVRDQVWNQVWNQVRDQVGNQVGDQVRDQVGDQVVNQVGKCGYGAHDAGWLSFYWTFRPMVEDCKKLDGMFGLAQSCGWWWPFENAVIFTERPCAMHRDAAGRLHNPDGLALAYPDGWGVYAWHGIRVPAWCIEHKNRVNKETILAEANTEIRRAMCEIIGWPRAMEMLGGKLIHSDECLGLPRKLIELDLNGHRIRLLHMTNGTVENGARREFIEGVPSTIGTCHEAAAWQCGVPARIHNEGIRT